MHTPGFREIHGPSVSGVELRGTPRRETAAHAASRDHQRGSGPALDEFRERYTGYEIDRDPRRDPLGPDLPTRAARPSVCSPSDARQPNGYDRRISSRNPQIAEDSMAIRFYGKAGSDSDSCPSVSVDLTDGSFVFVGYPITDPSVITEIESYSHIEPHEQAFRVPRELRKAIWEACGGHDPDFD